MDEQKNVPMPIQVSKLQGFIDFIREQGVVGLAIGFILGGAVSKIVGSLVDNVINPIVGIILGKVDLAERMITIGQASIKWGAFVSSIIDFVVIAAVVYFGFKMLGLEKLDRKKE
ncbi:MscL family protein [Candidatus Nomurabacteria bacterium]|nr:MAG: MscL family protein [Candidatus Nomurabacteria bacterium]